MAEESFEKGLESIVAEVMRVHFLDKILTRKEIVGALSSEDLERIRKEVLEKLENAERDGRNDRVAVMKILESIMGTAGPVGSTAMGMMMDVWKKISANNRPEES